MKMKNSFAKGLKLSISMIFILICSFSSVLADVTLPGVISDHMVLQRNMDVKIWGRADQNESVIVRFNNQEINTVAGSEGKWQVKLDAMAHGGPFEMTIKGKNTIVLKNILIGDVWICSGQSNMERRVQNSNNAQEEIAAANFPEIRLFDVKHRMAAEPRDNLADEKWQVCSPKTISAFSAVGYFFGQELHKNLNIPVGLISTNWGGTVSETWTSAGTISEFSEFDEKMMKLKSINLDEMIEKRDKLQQEWEERVDMSDKGMREEWYRLSKTDASWKDMDLPQAWEKAGLEGFDGIVWFICEFELSETEAQKDMQLNLGPIDDTDFTYVNGIQVGHVKKSWRKQREYVVGSDVLKPGSNVLCVRVIDYGGGGGLHGKSEDLFYTTSEKKVSLAGIWKYKIGTDKMPEQAQIGPNSFPTLLYNGMVICDKGCHMVSG
jgi:sialate O-acetylesterase